MGDRELGVDEIDSISMEGASGRLRGLKGRGQRHGSGGAFCVRSDLLVLPIELPAVCIKIDEKRADGIDRHGLRVLGFESKRDSHVPTVPAVGRSTNGFMCEYLDGRNSMIVNRSGLCDIRS